MVFLAWAFLLPCSLQDDGLPPIRKVSLKVRDQPLWEAIRLLSEKAGTPVHYIPPRIAFDDKTPDEKVSLELKDASLFEAAIRLCDAHGGVEPFLGDGMRIQVRPSWGTRGPAWARGLFFYQLESVEEETVTDFLTPERSCTVNLIIGWQEDLRVLSAGRVTVIRAVDDKGNDLGAEAKPQGKWEENDHGSIDRAIRLPLPRRGARSLTLTGRLDLDIPRRTTPVELRIGPGFTGAGFGAYRVDAARAVKGEEIRWRFTVRPAKGNLRASQILDLRIGHDDDYEYWIGWSGGGIEERPDGSLVMTYAFKKAEDPFFRFRIVEGKRRIQVPFALEKIPLPR